MSSIFFYLGLILAFFGLLGIFFCIYKAFKIRKNSFEENEKKKEFSKLALLNMAFLFLSSIGLISLIIGKIVN